MLFVEIPLPFALLVLSGHPKLKANWKPFYLRLVSQKSLLRRRNLASSSGDAIGFALLDASKHPSFLNSLDKSGFKSLDKLVVAYKPRKGKFAAFVGEISTEEVEWFIGSVLNGDVLTLTGWMGRIGPGSSDSGSGSLSADVARVPPAMCPNAIGPPCLDGLQLSWALPTGLCHWSQAMGLGGLLWAVCIGGLSMSVVRHFRVQL
ncbi:hypothetical protein HYC85_000118 [Camellia sinensis]|uniref:Uncharacterized protein n=1 Tax=Camellia sinensis TaxID=4442 RepID=A0A7J7FPT9_CAMSI|nr:hypothetical protein HYC85_000118 [Camellia sinensis]